MPRRCLTSGRKFSTSTSAFAAIRLSRATPSGVLRSSVMLRLLRCRFMKSEPLRGPPRPSPPSPRSGISILMTLAPQSASWRTQVGPERTRVRSSTVNRSSALEALGVDDLGRADLRGEDFVPDDLARKGLVREGFEEDLVDAMSGTLSQVFLPLN